MLLTLTAADGLTEFKAGYLLRDDLVRRAYETLSVTDCKSIRSGCRWQYLDIRKTN
jgi:hypothetical protein